MRWIDMHCDTLSEIAGKKRADKNTQENLRNNHLSVDIERLKRSGSTAQFFACYVNAADYGNQPQGERTEDKAGWDAAYQAVLGMTELAHVEAGKSGDFRIRDFWIAEKAADIAEAAGRNRKESGTSCTAGILTAEEGGILGGDITRLEELYERGIRLITLTWNYENCIGYPNSRDKEVMQKGLKAFGFQVVEEMNELGMLIDVSHLSDGGFWDCISHSRVPIVASHSNARSLCAHPRNLSDEMLRALGEKGGVAGLNFYSEFLRKRRGIRADSQMNAGSRASVEDIADHAVWMIRKAGEDAVAFGTDFDGFEPASLPECIHGVEDMEKIWDAMRKKGITPRQLDKIAYGNVMRMIREVWR